MKQIGILYSPSEALFKSGLNQTALTLAKLITTLGYEVTLLDYKNSDTAWWSDYPKTGLLSTVKTSNLYQVQGLDWMIDIDGRLSSATRQYAAKDSIVFLRTFLQFAEMEATVYIDAPYVPRDLTGVHEVWCWDILNPEDTLPSIQTMFPCPVKRVPFVWSPMIAQHAFTLHALAAPAPHTVIPQSQTYTVHVAEKNTTNGSSCILPLVAIRELVTKKHIDATYKLHYMEHIKDNRFFKENVADNVELSTLPVEMLPAAPYYEWLKEPNPILFSHARFTYLRMGLLNAVWMGLPVVHNSSVLRDLHPALAQLFYKGNDVREIVKAFTTFTANPTAWHSRVTEVQEAMVAAFGLAAHATEWDTLCARAFYKNVTTESTDTVPTEYIIAFEDMWPGFNDDCNFIMDALRNASHTIRLKGVSYSTVKNPHLLIFGPYTHRWKEVPAHIPKVYFSAENWEQPSDPSIKLYLTSAQYEDNTHMRIPTWMTFIDWFSDKTTLPLHCEDNPIRLPLHFATTPHPIAWSGRAKFCAFVVTNPVCPMRNEAFQAVNQYKPVSSGGALFNNIGGQLSLKYPGGGCGDISKHHFFAEHQFTLSFENSQAPGYVTEKLLHAKMAGCLPLYWGDGGTQDFTPNSFINLSGITEASTVVDVIKKLEARPDICEAMAATPLLNEEKKAAALTLLSRMSSALLGLLGVTVDTAVLKTPVPPKTALHGIEKTYIINLDTRPDRWAKLMAAEPYLSDGTVVREAAVNGRQLKMTQEVYDTFVNNQFQWKKSVIGCNLSHISVWSQITKQETGQYFLVLEDDVRFVPGWQDRWATYVQHIPEDADLLYLGGVLPPNKPALPLASEPYNEYWSFIQPNTFFSPVAIPVFHFCAYSYILTRRGAQKLMDHLRHSDTKSFTVSDHLLGHPSVGLTKYFTNPLLSYCFQEEDPAYVQSQFNDLHREDKFDSDLWNNTDCFSEEELAPFVREKTVQETEKTEKTVPMNTVELPELPLLQRTRQEPLRVYYMPLTENNTTFYLYEKSWLEDMFQQPIEFISIYTSEIVDGGWYLVQRPHTDKLAAFFVALQQRSITFKVIHVSDEYLQDQVGFYSSPCCKAVIRSYLRKDIPMLPHILTIPLGYHHRYTGEMKPWSARDLVWSFHGTNWYNRQEQLNTIVPFVPFSCNLQPSWNHPTATKERQYLSQMANSKFCPVMRGQNVETFRCYEALETGTLPITFVKDAYSEWMDEHLQLSALYDWTNPQCMSHIMIEQGSVLQQKVKERWATWKQQIKDSIKTLL